MRNPSSLGARPGETSPFVKSSKMAATLGPPCASASVQPAETSAGILAEQLVRHCPWDQKTNLSKVACLIRAPAVLHLFQTSAPILELFSLASYLLDHGSRRIRFQPDLREDQHSSPPLLSPSYFSMSFPYLKKQGQLPTALFLTFKPWMPLKVCAASPSAPTRLHSAPLPQLSSLPAAQFFFLT